MATNICTELLIMILNNLHSTQDLYSLLLVNRIWCKVTIPILWELPLGQDCCTDDKKLKKKALCIRTYISCMDIQTRTLLIQNGFDLSSSPPQATFDYPSFTHKFIINNLVYFISIYLQQNIGSYQNNCIITTSRLLFHEMCKLIINRCNFLDSFKMTGAKYFSPNFINYGDLIASILKFPGATKVFKKLESFTLMIRDDELIRPLYESLALICDSILNMNLELNSYYQVQLLANLIRVQKRLENLSIVANYYLDYPENNSIFSAIISQNETLKKLSLKQVSFYYFKGNSPIEQFISLQELYIEDCFGLHKSDSLFFASFPQLSSFHFRHKYNKYPQEFIIKIFEIANTKLRKIYLNSYTTDTFLAILYYCTNIIKLSLHISCLEHVIAIFNNNFNELRRFSFDCEERINADELFCQMAENVPKSLETIEIRIGIFSANSLRKFFEGWCCKGGGENKKIILRRTEQARLFALSDEHFKIIEEYGVQFDIEEYIE
ncbi:8227_t:CDS:1 [Diversispora eburnea]|uniref:8227_t:CDS:1 n=1 Tax=Diversispora eburnea TaxID=1213867 RepID=A0A9N9F1S7_9GLOM|nr:8227_t:CDS:1 [Diversispora eburnea]